MNRHFQESDKVVNTYKDNKIEKIEREGRDPYAKKLYKDLSEEEAYMREWCLINVHFPKFTNINKSYAAEPPTMKGEENPMYGESFNHSEESKNKISDSLKGENNHFYGKEHTEEWKEKMSGENHPNAELTKKEAREVKYLALNSDMTQKEIGKQYDILQNTVSRIKTEKRWPHIEPQTPRNMIQQLSILRKECTTKGIILPINTF